MMQYTVESFLVVAGQCSSIVKFLLRTSLGLNFVDKWFFALQCETLYYFVKRSWGRKFVGKENPRIHEHKMKVPQQISRKGSNSGLKKILPTSFKHLKNQK